jgi:hypothetical protein
MGEKDVDPGRFRSHFEKVRIDVGIDLNAIGRGSITTVDLPFYLMRLTHQIVGPTHDWLTTGLMQDGQYSVSWKDERTVYTHGQPDNFIMPDSMWGSVRTGHQFLLPRVQYYPGRNTHSFEIRNEVARLLSPPQDLFTVEIVLHGMLDHGESSK